MVDTSTFTVTLFSFGFKHGAPEAELVWDVRFLANPYWVPELKAGSGLDSDVAAYVLEDEVTTEFLALLTPLLSFSCTHHATGKRPELKIGIGCTGGRHRSVAVVEYLKKSLDCTPSTFHVFHRDIDKK